MDIVNKRTRSQANSLRVMRAKMDTLLTELICHFINHSCDSKQSSKFRFPQNLFQQILSLIKNSTDNPRIVFCGIEGRCKAQRLTAKLVMILSE